MTKEKTSKDVEDIKKRISALEKTISDLKDLISEKRPAAVSSTNSSKSVISGSEDGRVVKGFFDGEKMQGEDGQEYEIPANYASKSKLVEGDVLKLTISNDGTFIYKQIGPVERRKVIGTLELDENGHYKVIAPEKSFRVLLASVTYFKAQPSDQVTLVIPKDRECVWGAIESVIKRANPPEEGVDLSVPEEESKEEAKVAAKKDDKKLLGESTVEDLDNLEGDDSTFTI